MNGYRLVFFRIMPKLKCPHPLLNVGDAYLLDLYFTEVAIRKRRILLGFEENVNSS